MCLVAFWSNIMERRGHPVGRIMINRLGIIETSTKQVNTLYLWHYQQTQYLCMWLSPRSEEIQLLHFQFHSRVMVTVSLVVSPLPPHQPWQILGEKNSRSTSICSSSSHETLISTDTSTCTHFTNPRPMHVTL